MSSASLSPGLETRKLIARTATVALVAIVYFVAIIVLLHFARSDVDPIRRVTSEYAVGRYGLLMTSAFLSMSVATFALVTGLFRGVSQPARSWIGLGLLGLWALGVLVAAAFPIDPEGAPQTISGAIHRINGRLAFTSLTVGVILTSRRFKQDERWRPFYRSTLMLSLVMLAAYLVTLVAFATESGFGGLGQRVFLGAFVTWVYLTAARLRSMAMEAIQASR